jgi:hypothetical protein
MNKPALIAFFTICSSVVYCQHDFFIFKKKDKTIALFSKDSYIAFQVKDHQWYTGYITKVQSDSFYIKPMVVHYNLVGTDTAYYDVLPFTLADVFAMPKKGVQVDYINGRFQITTSGGHVHWYWVKSGWIFRAGAAGYAILNVLNGVIKNNFSFSGSNLGIAAAVFLFGELLHHTYKPTLRLGKKYYLQPVKVSNKLSEL